MKKIFLLSVLVMSFVVGGVVVANMEQGNEKQSGKKNGACKSDVEKFCKDIQRGGGKVVACLKEHQSELSNECKINMDRREKMHAFREACGEELKTHCPKKEGEKKPNMKLEVFACLEKHQDALSASCKEKLAEAK